MSERKRKHEAVSTSADDEDRKPFAVAAADGSSVGGGADKPAKRKETLDTSQCISKDGASPTFTDLPPGIVGTISTYIKPSVFGVDDPDKGRTGRDRRTLMSLCAAVGPGISSYIRKSCLESDISFITYLYTWIIYNGFSDDDDDILDDAKCALVGAKFRQWMEYNPWWREACQSPSEFIAKQLRNHPDDLQNNQSEETWKR